MTLRLDPRCRDSILHHAAREYPRECCGFLLGRPGNVLRIFPAGNVDPRPRTRFTVRPQDFLGAERDARGHDLEIVGFYHSHPDRSARPSASDSAGALAGFSHAIVSVHRGEPAELTSWRFVGGAFQPEPLEEVHVPLG